MEGLEEPCRIGLLRREPDLLEHLERVRRRLGRDEQVDVARAARPAERRGGEPADQDVGDLGELEGIYGAPEHGGEGLEIARRPLVYGGTGQHDVRTSKPRAATAGNALCTTVT